MDDEQAEDHGENGAVPEPELSAEVEGEASSEVEPERSLDEVEPELLATFTEIGIVETRRAIEAILLVATDPTPASLLAQLIEVPVEHVELLCHALADSYEEANHGFQLVKVAGGWRFQTHPDMAPYVERFAMDGQSTKLSNAALETLAIVAYKQPISRAQVSAIRGVNVDAVLRTLVQRGYVDEVGRDTGAGQAVLFGTTSMFLERLGINTVSDLPALGDFVPSAEVVEALEQTLKVDLDPDLVTTDRDGDDGPARPPSPSPDPAENTSAGDPAEASDGDYPEVQADAIDGDDPQADAAVAETEAEPEGTAEPEPNAEAEAADVLDGSSDLPREIDGPADSAPVTGEPADDAAATIDADRAEAAVVSAGDEGAPEPAQPASERVAEQAEEPVAAPSWPVAAPEGVVIDAEASPKSGPDGVGLPLGPGGQPAGQQAGGGQPEVAEPPSAPVAGPGSIGASNNADGPALAPDGGPDQFAVSRDPGDTTRPGADPAQPGPAAGRPHHEVPTGHDPGPGHGVEPPGEVGPVAPAPASTPTPTPTPTPAAGGQPSPQPGSAPTGNGSSAVPGRSVDGPSDDSRREPSARPGERVPGPAGGHRDTDQRPGAHASAPGGSGLAGSADPAVPPTVGPGPDLTGTEPVVDLRPPIDLTDPPAQAPPPATRIGPDADPA